MKLERWRMKRPMIMSQDLLFLEEIAHNLGRVCYAVDAAILENRGYND